MSKKMKYRLALKLGGSAEQSKSALAFAAIRLKNKFRGECKQTDFGKLVKDELHHDQPCALDVVVYDSSNDMLEPMPMEAFEARLKELIKQLPAGSVVNRVPFDKDAFSKFIESKEMKDSHEARAVWAQSLQPETDSNNEASC